MNQSNYSKIERDLQEPNLDQLKRICEILHVSPAYLLDVESPSSVTENDRRFLKDFKNLYDKYYK